MRYKIIKPMPFCKVWEHFTSTHHGMFNIPLGQLLEEWFIKDLEVKGVDWKPDYDCKKCEWEGLIVVDWEVDTCKCVYN